MRPVASGPSVFISAATVSSPAQSCVKHLEGRTFKQYAAKRLETKPRRVEAQYQALSQVEFMVKVKLEQNQHNSIAG